MKPRDSAEVRISQPATTIHYEYFGDGSKPLVVFFNAMGQTCGSWHHYLPLVLDTADALLWDYPGQGQSAAAGAEHTVESSATCLLALLQQLGLDPRPLHLLAACYGCDVAAEVLRQSPRPARAAVLTGAVLDADAAYIAQRRADRATLDDQSTEARARHFVAYSFGAAYQQRLYASPEAVGRVLRTVERSLNPSFGLMLDRQLAFLERIGRDHQAFATVDTPVLVIVGEEDVITPPPVQRRAQRMFAHASSVELPGAGHLVYMERHEAFFARALSFLLRGGASAPEPGFESGHALAVASTVAGTSAASEPS